MAARTTDFGLNYFGPGVPGSITDDGGKFTLGDRLLISRLLAALVTHTHTGGDRLADPTGPPAVTLDTASGQLPAGLNVYYRVGYVDRYGLETASSAEAVVSTPAPLAAPSFPILTTAALPSGSTATGLGAGTYSYALTALSGPSQTPLGIAAQLTMDATLPTVVVTFPDAGQDGQDQWGVWRRGPSESYYTFVGAVDVAQPSFTDDGSVVADEDAGDPSHQPPSSNFTNGTNAITVLVPDPSEVGADPGLVVRWRLYRSFSSGSYATSSLLADVATTVNADGTGGLITEWTDDGSVPLQPGQPLDVSQTLTPSVAIQGGGGSGAGALQLRSDDATTTWAVSAAVDGALVTDASSLPPAEGDVFLVAAISKQPWRVTVATDGALTTAMATPSSHDTAFLPGRGPLVATPDATLAYELTVAEDGALVTTAAGTRHPAEGVARVGNGAPAADGTEVEGLMYFDRTTAPYARWVFDNGAWHAAS